MSTSSTDVTLSVVVGSNGAPGSIEAFLDTLDPQLDDEVEVLVCEPAGSADDVRARYPAVRFLERPGALVPELWRDGIDAARGQLVALTISPMRPGAGLGRDDAAARDRSRRRRRRDRSGERPPGSRLGRVLLPLCARHATVRATPSAGSPGRQRRVFDGRAHADPRRLSVRLLGARRASRASRPLAAGFFTTRLSSSIRGDRPASAPSRASAHGTAGSTVTSAGRGSAVRVTLVGVIGSPLVPFLMTFRVLREVTTKRRHRFACWRRSR